MTSDKSEAISKISDDRRLFVDDTPRQRRQRPGCWQEPSSKKRNDYGLYIPPVPSAIPFPPFPTWDIEASTTVEHGSSEYGSIRGLPPPLVPSASHSTGEAGQKEPIDAYAQVNLNANMQVEVGFQLHSLRDTKEDDIPHTDSGYESVRDLLHPSIHGQDQNKTSDMDVNDANTSYSDFSIVLPQAAADKSIIDVCNNIYQRLEGLFDARDLMLSSQRLTALIKAFAIKLGSDMPDQSSLRVMHFVHTHHQYIVSSLESRFHFDEVDAMRSRRSMDTMPLAEIMSRWGETHDADPMIVDDSEYFEGIEDDKDFVDDNTFVAENTIANVKDVANGKDCADVEDLADEEDVADDDGDVSAFSGYEKTIVESAAYEWLISSLAKEASFHWDEAQPRTMVDQIRQEILEQLPTGRISSKRPPHRHTVSIKIPKSSLPFLPADWRTQSTKSSPMIIANQIVVTSASAYSVQVSKVSQYMDQTWPLGGGTLLSVLQNVINGISPATASNDDRDDSEIEIMLEGFYLEAIITGTSHSIAEYGEQLAWLAAALQPAASDLAMYIRPFLRRVDDHTSTTGNIPSWVIELWREGIDDADVTARSAQEWQGESKSPVIVRGFPTMIRPQNCPGIEVPPQFPVNSLPIPLWGGNETRFLLNSTGKVLQLFQETKGVTVWHILGSPEEVCTCRRRFLMNNDKDSPPRLDSVDLWKRRHIITECSVAEFHYKDIIPRMEHEIRGTEICQRECSLSEAPRLTPHSENVKDSSDSLDVDMLSIPDSSEYDAGGSLDTDVTALAIIEEVAHRLVSEYRQYMEQHNPPNWCPSNTKQCGPGEQQSSTTHGSSQSTLGLAAIQAASTNPVWKRPAEQDDGDGDGDDGEDSQRRPTQKKQKRDDSGKGPQFFACPFWKQNPGKHSNCFGKKLNMISRVKQHLGRTHSPKFYCDSCLVIFPSWERKRAHLREERSRCIFDDSAQLDGITSEQRSELSRKSDKTLSESEQWFTVWDIVFPRLCRPSSPYLDFELSQDLHYFREFSERRGPTLLAEVLHEEGIMTREGDEELIQRAANRAIRSLFPQWIRDRTAMIESPNSEESSAADPPGGQQYNGQRCVQVSRFTDQSSVADSGVVLGSHLSSSLAQEDAIQSPDTPIRPRPPSDVSVDLGLPAMTKMGTPAAGFLNNGANPPRVFVGLPPADMGNLDRPNQDEANHFASVLANSNSGEECPDDVGSDFWNHFLEDINFSSFQNS